MMTDLYRIIKYDSESNALDFKKEHYQLGKHIKKNEILKDISSFANHPSNNPKYIVIGIKAKKGIVDQVFDIDDTIDESIFQKFVSDNIEPKINFEFKYINYENKTIGYFKIYDNNDRPYLFKKDVINPVTNKPEFQRGDGYIRVGTSIKKMDRKDFDDVYKLNLSSRDRKDDLVIKPYFNYSDDKDLSDLEIKYIDIEIVNNSNKSIDLEVEMKVYKGEGFALISETDLRAELRKRRKESNNPFNINFDIIQPNLHISYKDEEDYVLISRNSLARNAAISLPQLSNETDVFCQHIFVLENTAHEIKADLIVRSDDFVNGPLKKELIFKQ